MAGLIEMGAVIAEQRKKMKITQDELCTATDVSRSTLGRLERGNANNITLETLERVCTALGLELSLRTSAPLARPQLTRRPTGAAVSQAEEETSDELTP